MHGPLQVWSGWTCGLRSRAGVICCVLAPCSASSCQRAAWRRRRLTLCWWRRWRRDKTMNLSSQTLQDSSGIDWFVFFFLLCTLHSVVKHLSAWIIVLTVLCSFAASQKFSDRNDVPQLLSVIDLLWCDSSELWSVMTEWWSRYQHFVFRLWYAVYSIISCLTLWCIDSYTSETVVWSVLQIPHWRHCESSRVS